MYEWHDRVYWNVSKWYSSRLELKGSWSEHCTYKMIWWHANGGSVGLVPDSLSNVHCFVLNLKVWLLETAFPKMPQSGHLKWHSAVSSCTTSTSGTSGHVHRTEFCASGCSNRCYFPTTSPWQIYPVLLYAISLL